MDSARSAYEDDAAKLKDATGPCVLARAEACCRESHHLLKLLPQVQGLARWPRRRFCDHHQISVRIISDNRGRTTKSLHEELLQSGLKRCTHQQPSQSG